MADPVARVPAAVLTCLLPLLAAAGIRSQDDPREREGLRHRRPASAAPLLIAREERSAAPSLPTGLSWIQGDGSAAAAGAGRGGTGEGRGYNRGGQSHRGCVAQVPA